MGPTNPELPKLVSTIPDPLRNFTVLMSGVRKRTYGNNVPIAGDPCWPAAALPVLRLIADGGATVEEIVEWCRRAGDPHHAKSRLAWLSLNDLVAYDDPTGKWKITDVGLQWLKNSI